MGEEGNSVPCYMVRSSILWQEMEGPVQQPAQPDT